MNRDAGFTGVEERTAMIQEIETEFQQIIPRTEGVASFRFNDPGGIAFRPGQFFELFLSRRGEKIAHYFSFSNSPTEKGYFEFTKRLSASPFSQALRALKPGDKVRMKLPLGRFIFEGQEPKVGFLSGGIGITPIRSICRYLTDTGSQSLVSLLYSARTEKDIVFREDFKEMAKRNPRLSLIYTLTDCAPPPGWRGQTGMIDKEMVRKTIPDYGERIFYICGPPGMVETLTGILENELGLPREKVIRENFTGY